MPAFAKVAPMTTVASFDQLFKPSIDENPFLDAAPLSENYKEFLLSHQRRVWKRDNKRGYTLDEQSFDLFRSKVRNIINEHSLGVKFWRAGVRHVNLAIFDRRPRGLGLPTTITNKAFPALRLMKWRFLSQWQLLRELVPPARHSKRSDRST